MSFGNRLTDWWSRSDRGGQTNNGVPAGENFIHPSDYGVSAGLSRFHLGVGYRPGRHVPIRNLKTKCGVDQVDPISD